MTNSPKNNFIPLAVLLHELNISSQLVRAARQLFLDRDTFYKHYQVTDDYLKYPDNDINLLSPLDYQVILNICCALASNFERSGISVVKIMDYYSLISEEIVRIEHLEKVKIAEDDISFCEDMGIELDKKYEDFLTAHYAEVHLIQAAKVCTEIHKLNKLSQSTAKILQGELL